jgi:hypothetical protein
MFPVWPDHNVQLTISIEAKCIMVFPAIIKCLIMCNVLRVLHCKPHLGSNPVWNLLHTLSQMGRVCSFGTILLIHYARQAQSSTDKVFKWFWTYLNPGRVCGGGGCIVNADGWTCRAGQTRIVSSFSPLLSGSILSLSDLPYFKHTTHGVEVCKHVSFVYSDGLFKGCMSFT